MESLFLGSHPANLYSLMFVGAVHSRILTVSVSLHSRLNGRIAQLVISSKSYKIASVAFSDIFCIEQLRLDKISQCIPVANVVANSFHNLVSRNVSYLRLASGTLVLF